MTESCFAPWEDARVCADDADACGARVWRCGKFALSLARPLVMGILNVTPDSFSDGGTHNSPDAAIEFAQKLLAEGADIIDVGGESTRPGSDEVLEAEELRRVLGVVRELASLGHVVSIDTRHASVAAKCVEAGAAIINDVSGFRDPAMVELAASCDAGLVVMHMLGEPKSMQVAPAYGDVAAEVGAYLRQQAQMLEGHGIVRDRICIDPGPGFGKTLAHNLELLRATSYLASLGYPLMVATSRKRFVGGVTGVERADERVSGSVASAAYAIEHGAAIARVHDVAATVQALKMLLAIRTVRCDSANGSARDAACGAVIGATLGATAPSGARRVFLGLGSNEGDRLAELQEAICEIGEIPGVSVAAVSKAYESAPAYHEDQASFANAVAAIDSAIAPHELLSALQQIELDLGRVRPFANAPRTIDIDILDYEGVVLGDPSLTLPHPRLLERDFVVTPMLECAAAIGKTVLALADGTIVTRGQAGVGEVTGVLGDLSLPAGKSSANHG